MKIIVDHTSMQPIYEQIVEQIKKQILQGTLREGAPLDSVRMLAKDLKVSALTVKKAYDALEEEQLIATVHGKGSFVLGVNPSLLAEEQKREIEQWMEQLVAKARAYGMSDEELRAVLELFWKHRSAITGMENHMNDGMVQLNKVTKAYGSFQLDCSMEVQPGMATGFVGANGAGKTTTFQILLGLVPPETGEIRIFGKPYTELTAKDRERIGVSLADSGFSQFLTVRDVTAILRNLYTRFDEARFLEKCQRYELPANKKIKDFSTGMQAKLKLLIAMSHDADLLILDEPTLGLDVMSREAMLEELQEYLDSEGTGGAPRSVLISSHISSDLEKFCDDIYMIDRGKIVLHEETDVLLDSYGILKVDERQYQALDRRYLLAGMREAYGYRLLTNERRYYQENYPDLVMEKGSIDDILILTARGEKL